ncbi:hypothetical protein FDP41_011306 [Naegleria fowleri]|uniref:Uncharacterized protein n=1 Tax=Naegleria fowleri TaxID=5763 RepID=A0A6A5C3Q6_NAEFO|nr:uncharacterized protein FDP41_011306 [Naegleria fowleri]KAF0982376.1 hypothetical protein FDP41_011306 [Naegleria fowleri]
MKEDNLSTGLPREEGPNALSDPCQQQQQQQQSTGDDDQDIGSHENSKLKSTACGIHFGATRFCCCVYRHEDDANVVELKHHAAITNQKYEIIPNEYGELTSGCVLSFIGEDIDFPQIGNNFITKPLVNDSISDNNLKFYPFGVIEGPNDEPYITVKSRMDMFAPELLTSFIFRYITQVMLAMSHYDCSECGVVLSAPCYFTETQKQALRESCEFNSVPVLDIIRGSSLLVCVEYIHENGEIELKGFDGDCYLGGDDFDNNIVKYACEEFLKKHNQFKIPPRSLRNLKYECEKAKINLSINENTSIHVKSLISEPNIDFSTDISRQLFEDLNTNLFDTCIETIAQLLSDLKLEKSQISKVVLVGGSCNMPKLKELLRNYFNLPSNDNSNSTSHQSYLVLLDSIPPEHVIAVGAAKKANELYHMRNQTSNVAAILPTFVDINPISIGIEVYGNYMTNILERNCYIPCTNSIIITPCCKDQHKITLKFLGGERLLSKDNITLLQVDLQCHDDSYSYSDQEIDHSTPTFKIECEVNAHYQLLIRVHELRPIIPFSIDEETNSPALQCCHSSTLKFSHTIDNYSQIVSQEEIFSMIKHASLTQSQDILALRMIHSMIVPSLMENPNSTAVCRLSNINTSSTTTTDTTTTISNNNNNIR